MPFAVNVNLTADLNLSIAYAILLAGGEGKEVVLWEMCKWYKAPCRGALLGTKAFLNHTVDQQ